MTVDGKWLRCTHMSQLECWCFPCCPTYRVLIHHSRQKLPVGVHATLAQQVGDAFLNFFSGMPAAITPDMLVYLFGNWHRLWQALEQGPTPVYGIAFVAVVVVGRVQRDRFAEHVVKP